MKNHQYEKDVKSCHRFFDESLKWASSKLVANSFFTQVTLNLIAERELDLE
jgi:hypothetical protein